MSHILDNGHMRQNKTMALPVFDENICPEDMDKMAGNAVRAANFLKAISHEGRLIFCSILPLVKNQ
jgi:hypothetical protein